MANYCCATRTNYFHVKDEDALRELMKHCDVTEDVLDLWGESDDDGKTVFGFGCYGSIMGYVEDPDDWDEADMDEFCRRLQKIVADDDAVLIFESGNEKLRYVVGSVWIITAASVEYHDIREIGIMSARSVLGNAFNTKCEY